MQTVTTTRTVDAAPQAVRAAMEDVDSFMRAAGFDDVTVSGRTVRVTNTVGLAEITLELALVDETDAALAYEQREDIFEEMRTWYTLTPSETGVSVRATTEFELDVSLVGDLLDATVIKRQRTKELEAQFDHLEEQVGG